MGLKSRRKGAGGEREVVALARQHGLDARRTWETQQSPNDAERACDVRIAGQAFEVKRSRHGFGALYDGVANVTGLFVRADGREWLAVVHATEFLRLLGRSEKSSV